MNKFRQIRKQKGLTLKQVAEDTGVSTDLIGKYERGERKPKIETLVKLSEYYSVPIEYFSKMPSGLIKYVNSLGSMTYEALQNAIVIWAYERNIVNSKNTATQFMKVTEELGELAEGINKDNQGQIKDSLGDILVTLIILSKDLDVDLLDCLRGAYDVIKDRTGKTVNGVFVKEEDLHE